MTSPPHVIVTFNWVKSGSGDVHFSKIRVNGHKKKEESTETVAQAVFQRSLLFDGAAQCAWIEAYSILPDHWAEYTADCWESTHWVSAPSTLGSSLDAFPAVLSIGIDALIPLWTEDKEGERESQTQRRRQGQTERGGRERERANSKVTPERCHSAVCPCRLRSIGHPGHTHSLCVAVEC